MGNPEITSLSQEPLNKKKNNKATLLFVGILIFVFVTLLLGGVFLVLLNFVNPSNKYQIINKYLPLGELETVLKSNLKQLSTTIDFENLFDGNVNEFLNSTINLKFNDQLKMLSLSNSVMENAGYYGFAIPVSFDLVILTPDEPVDNKTKNNYFKIDGILAVKYDDSSLTKLDRKLIDDVIKKYSNLSQISDTTEYVDDVKKLFEILIKLKAGLDLDLDINIVTYYNVETYINLKALVSTENGNVYLKINELEAVEINKMNNKQNKLIDDVQKEFLVGYTYYFDANKILNLILNNLTIDSLKNIQSLESNQIGLDFSIINTEDLANAINQLLEEIPSNQRNIFGKTLNTAFKNLVYNLEGINLFLNKNPEYRPIIKNNLLVVNDIVCEQGSLNVGDLLFSVFPKFLLDLKPIFELNQDQQGFNLKEFIDGINNFVSTKSNFENSKFDFRSSFCTDKNKQKFTGMDFYLSFIDQYNNKQYGGFGFFLSNEKQSITIPEIKNGRSLDITSLIEQSFLLK